MRSSAPLSGADGFDVLALSGGAYDGAYGAGVINGWTAAGSRPKFTVVTGVSAGALIAPLAFLGPDYDREIQEAFTESASQFLGDLEACLASGRYGHKAKLTRQLCRQFVDAVFSGPWPPSTPRDAGSLSLRQIWTRNAALSGTWARSRRAGSQVPESFSGTCSFVVQHSRPVRPHLYRGGG